MVVIDAKIGAACLPPFRTLRPHHQNGFGVRGEDGFLRGAIIGRNIRQPASLLVKPPRTSCQHEGRSLFTSTTPGRARVNSFHCPRLVGGREEKGDFETVQLCLCHHQGGNDHVEQRAGADL